jgi:hypothetical protein
MQLDVQGAIQNAFEEYITHLVSSLLLRHAPYNSPLTNDEALQSFEVGFQHALGVYELTAASVTKLMRHDQASNS